MSDTHANPLIPGTYLLPTPAGAFAAVAEPGNSRLRGFLAALLKQNGRAEVNDINLCQWSGLSKPQEAHEFALRLQRLGWIQITREPYKVSTAPLSQVLPVLLPALSREGKILLADTQGLYLHSHGFPHEAAEEISALSADIANMHARRAGVINRNLGLSGSAWALTNTAGHSQLGFWPLFIGSERFVLAIAGSPAFNQPQLLELIFALHHRFGK
ncbi:MAG: hypothetical protein Q4A28_00015 [Brachymonas sp.]|nr:hypothetical protein [Brachymonas sp.]